jgi:hypothetical protein
MAAGIAQSAAKLAAAAQFDGALGDGGSSRKFAPAEVDQTGAAAGMDGPVRPIGRLELKRTGEEINARFALVALARGRLLRADGSTIDERVATSTSLARSAGEWTADDPSQFRADLAVTADSLAREIVETLLVQGSSEEPAPRESADVTEGQP